MPKETMPSVFKANPPAVMPKEALNSVYALENVLDSIDAIVYVADIKNYEVLFANKYLRESMGVKPGQLCWKSIQKSPSGPCGFCPNDKLLDAEGNPAGTYRWEQLNTVDKRWYDTIDRAIIWTDGRLARFTVATDITDRKKMEESLQETNEKLNTLLKNSPDVIQVIDNRYNIIYTNEIMKETLKKGILGTSILNAIQEYYHPRFKEVFNQVVDNQKPLSFEYEGTMGKWWESEVAPITTAMDSDCIMMINRDITNRKQVEESLLETNQKLNTLLKNSPDTVLVIDDTFNVLYSNLLTRSSSANETQPRNFLETIDESYHEPFTAMFWKVVQTKEASSIEFIDTRGVWWESRAAHVLTHSNHNLKCAMLINRNITNRKKVEQFIRDSQHELECRIKERTAELEQTYQQLIQRDKLATLGFLISSIAHEINNPNSFISFNIPILQDYINDILPILDDHAANQENFEICGLSYQEFRDDVLSLLQNMKHGSQRIDESVSRLRDYIGSQEENEFKPMELRSIIEKGVELCRGKVNTLVDSFTVDIPEKPIHIVTVPQSLEQILMNLLINAAQSADKSDSWVRLTVISDSQNSGFISIEIQDNGCGIKPENLPRIFDPFFTTKKQQSGLGLGLNITKKLADEIGCSIEVDSQPHVGSCFRLIVPLQKNV